MLNLPRTYLRCTSYIFCWIADTGHVPIAYTGRPAKAVVGEVEISYDLVPDTVDLRVA